MTCNVIKSKLQTACCLVEITKHRKQYFLINLCVKALEMKNDPVMLKSPNLSRSSSTQAREHFKAV
ncbi:CLUMA_CG019754, isoform A [Clunio marinus]|uniref:CLUMA_CG019754, isoform A n=1 Tax=Clunio marinus TaxID=568069 RepID=A0A1J1J2D6_9DIPT|nr:CLUMA_CG019754, isoform A [Clunio marinus]